MPCHPGPGSRQPERRVRGDPRPAPSGSATGNGTGAALRCAAGIHRPRELVGYHIAYDLRILNLACQRLWGSPCPSAASGEPPLSRSPLSPLSRCRHRSAPGRDLSPSGAASPAPHDALSDAVTAALVFVRLHQGGPAGLSQSLIVPEITFNSHFAYMDSRAVR